MYLFLKDAHVLLTSMAWLLRLLEVERMQNDGKNVSCKNGSISMFLYITNQWYVSLYYIYINVFFVNVYALVLTRQIYINTTGELVVAICLIYTTSVVCPAKICLSFVSFIRLLFSFLTSTCKFSSIFEVN